MRPLLLFHLIELSKAATTHYSALVLFLLWGKIGTLKILHPLKTYPICLYPLYLGKQQNHPYNADTLNVNESPLENAKVYFLRTNNYQTDYYGKWGYLIYSKLIHRVVNTRSIADICIKSSCRLTYLIIRDVTKCSIDILCRSVSILTVNSIESFPLMMMRMTMMMSTR